MALDAVAVDLEAIENSLLGAAPKDVAPLPDPETVFSMPEAAAPDAAPAQAAPVDLMSEGLWLEQWSLLHDMGGGLLQARTGAPCPLGDQARSEGGRVAGEAAYALLSSNPALARLFLSTQSTFLGQIAAIGMHGFACIGIVRASARGDTLPPAGEFKTSRKDAA